MKVCMTHCVGLSQFCVDLASVASFALKTSVDRLDQQNHIFFRSLVDMASDSGFDYRSSQDSSHLDDLVDRFEYLRSVKMAKRDRGKAKKSTTWSFSVKTVKSNKSVLQQSCLNEEIQTRQRQSVRPRRIADGKWECDAEFLNGKVKCDSSNSLKGKSFESFADFRRDFYRAKHGLIKCSFEGQSGLQLTNIRLAPIDESVQNEFMTQLNQDSSHPPQLVYHGTQLSNIESILRYGLLVPHRRHPTNPAAPVITVVHGQTYGIGIYSSLTASYSVSYLSSTNTLLACAAVPHRNKEGKFSNMHGNILVLTKESHIIPMFLVDFKRSNLSQKNFPLYRPPTEVPESAVIEASIKSPRKYFRKILDSLHDNNKQKNRYQVRTFEVESVV